MTNVHVSVVCPCAHVTPLQAVNVNPCVGDSVNVTVVPGAYGRVHAPGQSIRYGSLRTMPAASPDGVVSTESMTAPGHDHGVSSAATFTAAPPEVANRVPSTTRRASTTPKRVARRSRSEPLKRRSFRKGGLAL